VPDTVEVLLDTTWRVADAENARTEGLDRKATAIATFASVVATLTATLGARFLTARDEWWAFALYGAGILLLSASVLDAVRVLLPKEHLSLGMEYLRRFPTWSEILKSPETVRGETMKGLVVAIGRERAINRRKARRLTRALGFLLGGVGAVILEALILGATEVF
jgi:hypothetical protein